MTTPLVAIPRTATLNGIAANGKQVWAGGWAQDPIAPEYVFLEGRKIGDNLFHIYDSAATLNPPYGRIQGVCPNLNLDGAGFWSVGHWVQTSIFAPSGTYGLLRTLIARSVGQGWKQVDSPNVVSPFGPADNWLYGVTAPYANSAWAVGVQGDFGTGAGPHTAMILRWDGTTWAVEPTVPAGDVSALYGVRATSRNHGWAVGKYEDASGIHPLTQRWDGSSWAAVPPPTSKTSNDELHAVTGVSDTNYWAVGQSQQSPSGDLRCFIMRSNGTSWVIDPSGHRFPGALWGVSALSSSEVWAVGSDKDKPLILFWNGKQWKRQIVPVFPHTANLQSVWALSKKEVWAAGGRYTGQHYMSLILRWDGVSWAEFPSQ
jgi:hypothetical protein